MKESTFRDKAEGTKDLYPWSAILTISSGILHSDIADSRLVVSESDVKNSSPSYIWIQHLKCGYISSKGALVVQCCWISSPLRKIVS